LAEGGASIDYTLPRNFVKYLRDNFGSYERGKAYLKPCFDAYPTIAIFLDDTHNAISYVRNKLKDLVEEYRIKPGKHIAAACCGLAAGFTAVFYIAITLIPSYMSTVRKYRSGVKATLNNPDFFRYRYAMDSVTILLGSAFWGCFLTASGAFALFLVLVSFFSIRGMFIHFFHPHAVVFWILCR
jgi:hypothetical protein